MKHFIAILFSMISLTVLGQEKVDKTIEVENKIKELKINGFNDIVFQEAEEYSVRVIYYTGEGFSLTAFSEVDIKKKNVYTLKQKGEAKQDHPSKIVISGPLSTLKKVEIKNADRVFFPPNWEGDDVNTWKNYDDVGYFRNHIEE